MQHLNAHSTSTPVGDLGELEAIKRVFGRDGGIAVSATKSATGHLLGAAGGVEAVFTILALRDQVAPPTLNLENADPAAGGIDLVANVARPMAIEHAISNGFGFGGVNASLVFRRWAWSGRLEVHLSVGRGRRTRIGALRRPSTGSAAGEGFRSLVGAAAPHPICFANRPLPTGRGEASAWSNQFDPTHLPRLTISGSRAASRSTCSS
ncbi:hypothetical protein [Kocuria rosea]|uniref:hypothetical protein n=1 Tax=Kocuria rosea TaxID=1275 RepID=UPI0020135D77